MHISISASWSAVAAVCAAFCSFMILLIQRRNLQEVTRPEIALTGWTREMRRIDGLEFDVLSFRSIRNVGKGVALNLLVTQLQDGREPLGFFFHLPVLAINDTEEVNGEIKLFWKPVETTSVGYKFMALTLTITCYDSRGKVYQTLYKLLVNEPTDKPAGSRPIAPGVMLVDRVTKRLYWWYYLSEATQLMRSVVYLFINRPR